MKCCFITLSWQRQVICMLFTDSSIVLYDKIILSLSSFIWQFFLFVCGLFFFGGGWIMYITKFKNITSEIIYFAISPCIHAFSIVLIKSVLDSLVEILQMCLPLIIFWCKEEKWKRHQKKRTVWTSRSFNLIPHVKRSTEKHKQIKLSLKQKVTHDLNER